MDLQSVVATLNPAQRAAAMHGLSEAGSCEDRARSGLAEPKAGALLVLAGAGSGKTNTLAHRVAQLILHGADPRRILLLTFTRRAAGEMTRRTRRIVERALAEADNQQRSRIGTASLPWSGTFHGVANRLLRLHAASMGLDASFTVLDRGDSADLLNLLRDELGFSKKSTRFPRKGTCLSIYSHVVNSQQPIESTLARAFPWCDSWVDELRTLFGAYVEAKQRQNVLDYDDLLLYWHTMMAEPALAERVARRFDHVLVDEYQDTNALQASILMGLKPSGTGLTVVGDDAQSIYSFRAANVRNILDFPECFEIATEIVKLEQNYRSTSTILEACNAVIGLSTECFPKKLFSTRLSEDRPQLVSVEDENVQVDYVVERVLAHRESGIALRSQAVLIRASHHSDALEVELGRRNIPFVKYGGLKFLESAHVKDMLCVLRWVENPRDAVAAFRVLQILPGVGPAHARRAMQHLSAADLSANAYDLKRLRGFRAPAAAAQDWPGLCKLLEQLREASTEWHGQVAMVRHWYQPHLERLYDAAGVRAGDLEQLEQISSTYPSRERFLSELSLDPPEVSGDEAGPPHLDEDFLILSTIHSAKGQEWDVVFVLNAADGCIPSDMATGSPEQIEEERRLLYVAMTRARDHLHLVHPQRFFKRQQHRHGDAHVYTPRSRFIPDAVLDRFERSTHGRIEADDRLGPAAPLRVDVGARMREMWR